MVPTKMEKIKAQIPEKGLFSSGIQFLSAGLQFYLCQQMAIFDDLSPPLKQLPQ